MEKKIFLPAFILFIFTTSCIRDPLAERNEKELIDIKSEVKNLNKEIDQLKYSIKMINLESNIKK